MASDTSSDGERRPAGGRPGSRPAAVALGYDLGGESLPRILAKGHGTLAERIVEMAFESGVRVREDADLAELLSAVDLDSEIPAEAIVAVAEILAYVYRANGTLPADEETPP